jgi:hypothetical protein
MGKKGRHKVQREVVHTLFIFFIDITQTSPIPVDRRAIATFLEGEGVLIMFMVLFHVSLFGNPMHHS